VFSVERCQGGEEMFEFDGYLAVEGGCCPPTGIGQRHV
jgi:hypothetical protein